MNAGNRGNILDFFKSFQPNSTDGSTVVVKSIQIFTGLDIETNIKSTTITSQEVTPQKITPSKQQKPENSKTKQDTAPKKKRTIIKIKVGLSALQNDKTILQSVKICKIRLI